MLKRQVVGLEEQAIWFSLMDNKTCKRGFKVLTPIHLKWQLSQSTSLCICRFSLMRREEKRSKLHEALLNTIYPPDPEPELQPENEKKPLSTPREDFDVKLIPGISFVKYPICIHL